ncbi:MAG: GAF domain-containing protein [Chloroflexota bacterium]|nr:MAG: GAF domain-containing protein [Chloroflexota bacterium]
MANESIFLVFANTDIGLQLETGILAPAGYEVTLFGEGQMVREMVKARLPDLIILGDQLMDGDGLELARQLLSSFPNLPIILVPDDPSEMLEVKSLRLGLTDYLVPPLNAEKVLQSVQGSLERRKRLEEWVKLEFKRNTKSLQKRVDGMEALQRIGRSVTALLDLDNVLKAVVDAAVELTGAEEGSLLLLDETSGELYMRAARNFQEDFVRTFRVPIRDTLPGQVLRTGKPLLLDVKTPQKIKTSYLVHNLIYVPLQAQGRMIGALGVDNRQSGHPFADHHITLMSALGDYAAIAIENARLYSRTEIERKKLETILTQVEDGVIVLDHDGRLILVNDAVRFAFNLGRSNLVGKHAEAVIQHTDLVDLLLEGKRNQPSRSEITIEDGRVFNAQLTPIPDVGLAVTMQDITHLKELDRIKSDFVTTVSHDLRSPLTAILGYVELIDRAGPVNDQQREFIRRVQFSVNNITALINDLLDLGRIEAGFDALKEIVPLSAIIRYAAEGYRNRLEEKKQHLTLEIADDLPPVLGNPVRLRQMIGNMIGNAIKYTPSGGKINVRAKSEEGQIIVQVCDNGPGIPPADQPYIFDKFYRASNIPADTPGTGLGLAIVKSIVENHQGRIWVDSLLGQGSTFTVVLPIADEDL